MRLPTALVVVTIPVCVRGPRTSHPGTDVMQLPTQLEENVEAVVKLEELVEL